MSDSRENRVASSITTRGSQDPNRYAGYDVIVQPVVVRHNVTVEDVNRVLEVGKLLRSVLTPDELEALHKALYGSGVEAISLR